MAKVKCDICGKEHERKNVSEWAHYRGETFCRAHPGVEQFMDATLLLANLKLRYSGEDANDERFCDGCWAWANELTSEHRCCGNGCACDLCG